MNHAHGGNPQNLLNELGLNPEKVIDFSVNIAPYGVPEPIKRIWSSLVEDLIQYPTTNGNQVKELFAKQYNIAPDHVLAGNGSIECLYLLPRVLKLNKVGIIGPSFFDYERAFRASGSETSHFFLTEEKGFSVPGDEEIQTFLETVDGLVLGSPNNPTGTFFPADWIIMLAEKYPEKWFIVDEAFIHFLDDYPSKTLVNPQWLRPNICVLQSLTKFYALPGIRLGALIAPESVVSSIEEIKGPWSINRVAESIASVIPLCGKYEKELIKRNERERSKFMQHFNSFDEIRLYPNQANFFLAQWFGQKSLDELIRYLLERGIFLRDCRNFNGLKGDFFRFSIRTTHENTQLMKAFEGLKSQGRYFDRAV